MPLRRDRDGDFVEDLFPGFPSAPPVPPHHCHNGWLGEDANGLAVPCLLCKPHLEGWIHNRAVWTAPTVPSRHARSPRPRRSRWGARPAASSVSTLEPRRRR